MKNIVPSSRVVFACSMIAFGACALVGCDSKTPPPPPAVTKQPASDSHAGHGHAPGETHTEHAHATGGQHAQEGQAVVDLGAITVDGYLMKATRDQGDIGSGKEIPIDVAISGGAVKIAGVRFWIGTQDGKGSMKAKAEVENPKNPTGWHTHVEIPTATAARNLWVEIEVEGAKKVVGSFNFH